MIAIKKKFTNPEKRKHHQPKRTLASEKRSGNEQKRSEIVQDEKRSENDDPGVIFAL